MSKFIINGGHKLNGEIVVAGNKNAALPIIAATALSDEECIIRNLPDIRDVQTMLKLLEDLGKKIVFESANTCRISGSLKKSELDERLAGNLRASVLYLSVLLARTGSVHMTPPGGCVIGRRNMDSHFDVLTAFGAETKTGESGYKILLNKAKPATIFLREASVTATENAMLLAASIPGNTHVENAAGEPHVADLAEVLHKMGAQIAGAGSNRMQIAGQKKLNGFDHTIVADHIEAGTFAIAAAATRSELIIHGAFQKHLQMPVHYLQQLGVDLQFVDEKTLRIRESSLIAKTNKIQVGLWPAFPTDLMSPMIVLASQVKGNILCHDWMFESRMFFVDKLIVMGAEIVQCDPHRVMVSGPTQLHGQELSSPDIRAGIALVIAALAASGLSSIDRVELIDRGYERIDQRLNQLGAKIVRE